MPCAQQPKHSENSNCEPFCGFLVIYLCLASTPAAAGHTASPSIGVGSASPINTESAVTLPRGRWTANLRTEYTSFERFSDTELIALREAHPEADLHSADSLLNTSFGAFYGITDDLTIGFRLPYVWRSNIREPGHHEEHEGEEEQEDAVAVEQLGDTDGIGDLVLFGQYRFFYQPHKHHAAIQLGVKAPTGDTDERSPEGELIEAEFQPGTGSWDGLFGLAYTYWFSPFALDTNMLYTVVTEGTQDTELGDVFNYNFALSYRVGGGPQGVFYAPRQGLAWDLILELNGEWRDTAEKAGVEDPDFGGHLLYFSPGIRLTIGSNWTLAVSGGIPVVTDLNGQNLADPDYRVTANLGFSY